ncbi:unnamed protein product [Notodromas monacha]|uniref:PHD finger protein rhinoceros n=1 Tax=Notodromas monacha TaxID=399045 RepID=A0A7R9GFA4_9CRUS|nr:unnamed protein product [Notodromas monacha]CAG0920592.1 unnamed protein product [Notodromas monacha]
MNARTMSSSSFSMKRRRPPSSSPSPASASPSTRGGSVSCAELPPAFNSSSGCAASKPEPAELYRKDLISAMKLPDNEPLAPDEYYFVQDSWKQEWERGVQWPVNPDYLPEAQVKIVESAGSSRGDFKPPKNRYIHLRDDDQFSPSRHYLSKAAVKANKVCKYDLDEIDLQWISLLNRKIEIYGLSPVSESKLERVIEALEISAHRSIRRKVEAEIENLDYLPPELSLALPVCDVCRCSDSESGNELVTCSRCRVCVHQACYGILNSVRNKDWLCKPCSQGVKEPECLLCTTRGCGAMKTTKSGQHWAHVSCAFWIPEASFGCFDKMEPITKITAIPPSRWSLTCGLCGKQQGACITCSVSTCKAAYHVTCGFRHSLEMRVAFLDESNNQAKLKSYCQKHSMKKECVSDGEFDQPDVKKRRRELTDEQKEQARALRMQQLEAEFFKYVDQVTVADSVGLEPVIVDLVYNYWLLKRRTNFNKPLIAAKFRDTDLNGHIGRKKHHKSPASDEQRARLRVILHLRQDLERVRNLCYMVSRREKLVRAFFKTREQTFVKQAHVLRAAKMLSSSSPNSSQAKEDSAHFLDEAAVEAVIQANHGPSIYDTAFSHENARMCRPEEFETLLARISGSKMSQNGHFTPGLKDLNGVSRDVGSGGFLLDNPYRRTYLNSAERRRLGLSSRSASSESASGSSTAASSACSSSASASEDEDDKTKTRKKSPGAAFDMKSENHVKAPPIYTDSEDERDVKLLRDAGNKESGPDMSSDVGSSKSRRPWSKTAGKSLPEKVSKENLEPSAGAAKVGRKRVTKAQLHSTTEMEISSLEEAGSPERASKKTKKFTKTRGKKGAAASSGDEDENMNSVTKEKTETGEKRNRFLGRGRPRKSAATKSVESKDSKKNLNQAASGAGSRNDLVPKAALETSETLGGAGILSYVPQRRAARKAAENITDISKSKDMIEEMLLREVTGEGERRQKSVVGDTGSGAKRASKSGKRKDKKSIFSASDDSDLDTPALLRVSSGTERLMTKEEKDAEFDRLLGEAAGRSEDKITAGPSDTKLKTSEGRSGREEPGPPSASKTTSRKARQSKKRNKDVVPDNSTSKPEQWKRLGAETERLGVTKPGTGASWQKPRKRVSSGSSASGTSAGSGSSSGSSSDSSSRSSSSSSGTSSSSSGSSSSSSSEASDTETKTSTKEQTKRERASGSPAKSAVAVESAPVEIAKENPVVAEPEIISPPTPEVALIIEPEKTPEPGDTIPVVPEAAELCAIKSPEKTKKDDSSESSSSSGESSSSDSSSSGDSSSSEDEKEEETKEPEDVPLSETVIQPEASKETVLVEEVEEGECLAFASESVPEVEKVPSPAAAAVVDIVLEPSAVADAEPQAATSIFELDEEDASVPSSALSFLPPPTFAFDGEPAASSQETMDLVKRLRQNYATQGAPSANQKAAEDVEDVGNVLEGIVESQESQPSNSSVALEEEVASFVQANSAQFSKWIETVVTKTLPPSDHLGFVFPMHGPEADLSMDPSQAAVMLPDALSEPAAPLPPLPGLDSSAFDQNLVPDLASTPAQSLLSPPQMPFSTLVGQLPPLVTNALPTLSSSNALPPVALPLMATSGPLTPVISALPNPLEVNEHVSALELHQPPLPQLIEGDLQPPVMMTVQPEVISVPSQDQQLPLPDQCLPGFHDQSLHSFPDCGNGNQQTKWKPLAPAAEIPLEPAKPLFADLDDQRKPSPQPLPVLEHPQQLPYLQSNVHHHRGETESLLVKKSPIVRLTEKSPVSLFPEKENVDAAVTAAQALGPTLPEAPSLIQVTKAASGKTPRAQRSVSREILQHRREIKERKSTLAPSRVAIFNPNAQSVAKRGRPPSMSIPPASSSSASPAWQEKRTPPNKTPKSLLGSVYEFDEDDEFGAAPTKRVDKIVVMEDAQKSRRKRNAGGHRTNMRRNRGEQSSSEKKKRSPRRKPVASPITSQRESIELEPEIFIPKASPAAVVLQSPRIVIVEPKPPAVPELDADALFEQLQQQQQQQQRPLHDNKFSPRVPAAQAEVPSVSMQDESARVDSFNGPCTSGVPEATYKSPLASETGAAFDETIASTEIPDVPPGIVPVQGVPATSSKSAADSVHGIVGFSPRSTQPVSVVPLTSFASTFAASSQQISANSVAQLDSWQKTAEAFAAEAKFFSRPSEDVKSDDSSRNQLKVKIKGPFRDAKYSPQLSGASGAGPGLPVDGPAAMLDPSAFFDPVSMISGAFKNRVEPMPEFSVPLSSQSDIPPSIPQPVLPPLTPFNPHDASQTSSTVASSLRRMRKKEIIREYCAQEDPPVSFSSMPMNSQSASLNASSGGLSSLTYRPSSMPGLISRGNVSQFRQSKASGPAPLGPRIPKAVASMAMLPTQNDYRDFVSCPSSPPFQPPFPESLMFPFEPPPVPTGKGKKKRRKGRGGGGGVGATSASASSSAGKKRPRRGGVSARELASLGWTIKDKEDPIPPPGLSLTLPLPIVPEAAEKVEEKVTRARQNKQIPCSNPVVVLTNVDPTSVIGKKLKTNPELGEQFTPKAPPKIRINLSKNESFQFTDTPEDRDSHEACDPLAFTEEDAKTSFQNGPADDISALRRVRPGKPLKKRISDEGDTRNGMSIKIREENMKFRDKIEASFPRQANGTAEGSGKKSKKSKSKKSSTGPRLILKLGGRLVNSDIPRTVPIPPEPTSLCLPPVVPKLKLKLSKDPAGGYVTSTSQAAPQIVDNGEAR